MGASCVEQVSFWKHPANCFQSTPLSSCSIPWLSFGKMEFLYSVVDPDIITIFILVVRPCSVVCCDQNVTGRYCYMSMNYLWPPYVIGQAVIGQAIIFLPCGFYLSIYLFSSPNLSGHRLDVYHTSTHGVALVRIYNAGLKCAARRLAANTGRKKVAKNRHLGTIAQLCRAISSQLRHISEKTC